MNLQEGETCQREQSEMHEVRTTSLNICGLYSAHNETNQMRHDGEVTAALTLEMLLFL